MYIKDIRSYIFELNFKILIENNKIYISNYKKINSFDDNKIVIIHEKGLLTIEGTNLRITKLLKDELLINGKIDILKMSANE